MGVEGAEPLDAEERGLGPGVCVRCLERIERGKLSARRQRLGYSTSGEYGRIGTDHAHPACAVESSHDGWVIDVTEEI